MEKRKISPGIVHQPDPQYYHPASSESWTGRVDGTEPAHQRWHQKVELVNLTERNSPHGESIALLGFACDEGVRRNQGRVGAAHGPNAIRKALSNLPFHEQEFSVGDMGNIVCTDGNLEIAQYELALTVKSILQSGSLPMILGGGHEVTYGHYCGIRQYLDERSPAHSGTKLGIINFDAHFDNRKPDDAGISSGTGFWQIEQEEKEKFHYLALGIQRSGNTRALFDRANQTNTQYILAEKFRESSTEKQIEAFCAQADHLYLTIDLDVFAAAFAPGVSAPSAWGIHPDEHFLSALKTIIASGKLISLDIAEMNPTLDQDQHTAKLAANLLDQIVVLIR